MIEFHTERARRVREFLATLSRGPDDAYEPTHRTLAQSYKVDRAQTDVARLVGAIAFLFTGEPESFQDLLPEDSLCEALRIFRADEHEGASRSLLLDHARAVLEAQPRREHRGYIDWEQQHLTFLGGRMLFQRVVEALIAPYEEQHGWRTFAQAAAADVSMWLLPAVIRRRLDEGARHWPDWKSASRRRDAGEP